MSNGNTLTVSLAPGGLEPAVLQIIDQVNEQAQLPVFVDMYIETAGISEDRFTPDIRAAMVDYLRERGAEFESIDAVQQHEYDELFALAYESAITRKAGRSDP